MAGRKQHYIQQHLSRGFAIDPNRDPAQLWIYRKGADGPFVRSIANYGVQRDFYATPDNTFLDDIITDAEQEIFDKFIIKLREAKAGSHVDPRIASRFYQHLLFRSKNVRSVITDSVTQLMQYLQAGLLQKEKLETFLVELFTRHLDQLISKIEQEVRRPLIEVERVAIAQFLEKNIPTMVPQFLEIAWPHLTQLFTELVCRVPEMIEQAHQKTLKKFFLDDSGKRESEMRLLQWRVHDVERDLVLGDSCVFAELTSGRFVPIPDVLEVANLYLPISGSRYLVGNISGERPLITEDRLNNAAIACSYESFCGAKDLLEFRNTLVQIGSSVMPLSTDELHQLSADCLGRLWIEQLSEGI